MLSNLFLKRNRSPLPAMFAGLFLVAQPLTGLTQPDQDTIKEYYKNWYQVEIFLFENKNPIPNDDKEVWSKDISLLYPANLQHLIDPTENTSLPDENLKTSETQSTPSPGLTAQETVETEKTSDLFEPEQPFIILDSESHTLTGDVNALIRSRKYRQLAHLAWRQPMLDKSSAPNIVLSGGKQFDQNNELEGTVSIHVSRYLHISTNLWLTHFEPNFGQPSHHWPPLPPQPQPPKQEAPAFMQTDISLDSLSSNSSENWNFADARPSPAPADSFSFENDQFEIENKTFAGIPSSKYITTQVVTFKNKRRMRSGELHYIDHPLIGMIIKIDKYFPEELKFIQSEENN